MDPVQEDELELRRRQADRLRELAAMETDPQERDRLLETAAEVEGHSLSGAANPRASAER